MKGLFSDNANPWIKNFGVYFILILAVLRLFIYPLHMAVKDKQAILADQQQTFLMKSRLLDQARRTEKADSSDELNRACLALYPRAMRLSEIQAEMLTLLSHFAEKKGLMVLGFEAPEAVHGNKISEITVVLRLSGDARSCIELLKSIEKNERTFIVKAMEISSGDREMNFALTISAFRMDT